MKKDNEPLQLLAELLVERFGVENIKGLLTGKLYLHENPPGLELRKKAYVRHLKDAKTPFTDYDGHEYEIDADLLLIALEDAAKEMSYSNWATDKFDRASELIIRYCKEHKIPLEFKTRKGRQT